MTTAPAAAAPAKKDTQKLQRAIIDGLEDVKAQDIVVFDTEHLSALFERVIIASGTSNRQTKALASSVRDAVRDAGFPKPRMEGEANGEWIIVDCAQAVVHIMQPNFRQYYHLEELWGEKPVRLKLGAPKPAISEAGRAAQAAAAKDKSAKEKAPQTLKRSNAAKKGVAEAFPSKAQVRKAQAAVGKPRTRSAAAQPAPAPARKTRAAVQAPRDGAPAAKSAVSKAAAPKATAAKKVVVVTAGKAPAKRAASAARKPAARAPAAKKAAPRKA